MASDLRQTGISVVGDIPGGTHFCSFYDTRDDLLDIVIPYFKTGLENKEFCLWVISNSELVTVEEATSALRNALPDFERYSGERSIELVGHDEWFLDGGAFELHRVANRFREKLNDALARGYVGMRFNGSPLWLIKQDEKALLELERELDKLFPNERLIGSCTYPLAKTKGDHIFDVARTHEFAVARRNGNWEVVETPRLKQAKAEIERLNEELEQRVLERTNELRMVNEELRKEISERRQAEALLHANQQEFRAIVENAPDQIIRYDREFRRTYVNPAVAKAYGLPAEALTGKPIGAVIKDAGLEDKEDELAQIRRRIAAVFTTGKSDEYEINWPMPTGRRYYSVRLFPELDLNGTVINVLGISRDITERRSAEEQLKKEKEILGKIFDNIPVMIGFVGDDGDVKLVNPEWERTIGWTLKELQEQNVDIFAEAYPDLPYRKKVLDFVAAATGEWVDLKIKVREGRVIDAACAVVHLSDGTKVAIAQDITERKRAEEQLRQGESMLAEAQHLAHVGSWSLDLRSNTVTWSDELYRIFGVQPSEFDHGYEAVIGTTHPEDREWLRSVIEDALKTHEPFSVHYRITQPSGEVRVLHARGAVVTDEHGNASRLHGAAQDVTERQQAEEQLRATTEQLRALSASLQSAREEEATRIAREIHDELGAALSSLRWDLEEIDEAISESREQSQLLKLRKKIEAMMRLTDTTINSVRRIASEMRPIALDALGLSEAIEWQARQFQDRTGIIVQCDCGLENLEMSREQSTAVFRIFQEALTNILRHAQATRVDVQMSEKGGEFILTITDNGRGITDDEKSGTRTLGLVGMRERAHLIGGTIDITGSEGKGTMVTVRIPIAG